MDKAIWTKLTAIYEIAYQRLCRAVLTATRQIRFELIAPESLLTLLAMESPRVTHKEIARIAGVHRSTISLALKGHPSIPQATQRRIRNIAAKLGYTPDPMLSALSAYRLRQQPHSYHGTLAWLSNNQGDFRWRDCKVFAEYFDGATRQARTHGYHLEAFDLAEKKMTPARMASIFQARNIQGILVCPQPKPGMELKFDWSKFAAVTFGYTLAKPELHTIAATQYRSTFWLMHQLREMGYRRMGLVYRPDFNERTNYNYVAGFLAEQFMTKAKSALPFYDRFPEKVPFRKWLARYKPDVIITPDQEILEILRSCGLKVPRDVSVACSCVPTNDTVLSGISENPQHIGAVAVDFLTAMIHRGELGIPEIPQRLHVEGTWRPGKTLALASRRS